MLQKIVFPQLARWEDGKILNMDFKKKTFSPQDKGVRQVQTCDMSSGQTPRSLFQDLNSC
jgi:hypothetical protein